MEPTTSQFNLDDFSKKSEEYYATIKSKLEASDKGKFVAIDYTSQKYWIAETASDALNNAKKEFPDKLFYLIQIGSVSTFSIQSFHSSKKTLSLTNHGFAGTCRR